MSRTQFFRGTFAFAAVLALALPAPAQAQSSSASYVLQQQTVNSAGDASSSVSYRFTGSAAQETAVGASSAGASYVLQSGFWSFTGSGLVPVLLSVSKDAVAALDLNWTGNNAPYQIFRSGSCVDTLSSPFDTSTTNSLLGVPPTAAQLECFNVLATAPGPTPPPNER